MLQKKALLSSPIAQARSLVIVIFVLVLGFPLFASRSVLYSETKGPFKNWTQVIDLDGDSDLDVLVSHTRWEEVDISWAGIGRWINHGSGRFELIHDEQMKYFAAFAAGAGDTDQDGDMDIFVQDFNVHLLVNQSGQQGEEPGKFATRAEIYPPSPHNNSYRDMGGTITTGDLNGDGKSDAFVAGCCYGMEPAAPANDHPHSPSISWVWINDGEQEGQQTGHVLPLDFLDGLPIREAALGDVDGDGDLDVVAAVGSPTMGELDALDDLILLNDGAGNLTVSDRQLVNADSTSVALGDVNGSLARLIQPCSSRRLSAPYNVPVLKTIRPLLRALTSFIMAYPCLGAGDRLKRMKNVASVSGELG